MRRRETEHVIFWLLYELARKVNVCYCVRSLVNEYLTVHEKRFLTLA